MLCVLGVYKQGVGQETLEHVEAYRIQTNPLMGPESPQVGLDVSAQGTGFPDQVTLCADARCMQKLEELVLRDGRIEQQVKRQSEDRYYHVRTMLPRGTWAYSKQILIPGYQPPPMGELLVRFVSEGKAVGKVGFAVTDATGKSVAGEADKSISLRAGPVSIVGEVKPYAPFEKQTEVKKSALTRLLIDLGKLPPPPGMVEILASENGFLMGSNDGEGDEKPVHRVKLPTYYLDLYEVTTEQYGNCVRAGGCQKAETGVFCNAGKPERAKHPINCVDWSQAAAYCKWAGKRLPTEEEWEYAARGTDGRTYPWGNRSPTTELCWNRTFTHGTCGVGSKPKDMSPFGVMDLGGNVTEWVQDWYRDSYRTSGGPTKDRSLRGGSWVDINPSGARAPYRFRFSPMIRDVSVGFRCARTK